MWVTSFWVSKSVTPFKLIINRLAIAALWSLSEFAVSILLQSFPLQLLGLLGFFFVPILLSYNLPQVNPADFFLRCFSTCFFLQVFLIEIDLFNL
jgi:hypothetical protein